MFFRAFLVSLMVGASAWAADETHRGLKPVAADGCAPQVAAEATALSPNYEAFAAKYPALASVAAFRALPWQAETAEGFRTDEMKFGKMRGSYWTVRIDPAGVLDVRLVVSAEDDFTGVTDQLFGFAESTVSGSADDTQVENLRRVLSVFDIRDDETGATEGACSGGRGLFVSRLFEYLNGKSPEATLASSQHRAGLPHLRTAVQANARFGTALGRELARAAIADRKNFFFSPTSIGTAWGMAANGAEGETLAQMMKVFHTSASDGDLLAGLGALAESLTRTGAAHSANALYGNHDVTLKPSYVELLKETVGAEATTLDFAALASLDAVNGFVAKHTDQMIPTLLDRLDPSGVLYLINAVGLKVKWSEKFDKELTHDQQFRSVDGIKTVSMMSRQGRFRYMANEHVQGITLETEGGKVAVDFFLPKADLRDERLAVLMDLTMLQDWASQFDTGRTLEVSMPRLKLRYRQNLIPAMQTLGVSAPFTDGVAQFGRMANVGSFISLFLHEAVLELDEEGAKAAAATVVGTSRSISVPEIPTIVFDRPYLLSFRDTTTGEVLFSGVVTNP